MISSEQLICSVHNNPFDSLSISIQLIQNVNRNIFHDFYEPKNGFKTSITTPFYWGDIQGSLQVVPYYNKWLQDLPSINIVANSNLEHILKKWEGLGYYARARNFYSACKLVENQF